MTEKFPTTETPERDTRYLEQLRRMVVEGVPEEERVEVIREWQTSEESVVENTPRASVEFEIRRADIKAAAGFLDDAWEDFQDALDEARGCGFDDLAEEIRKKMEGIR